MEQFYSLSQLISLVLPLLLSGITLVVILKKNKFAFLNIPLDHHLHFRGKRLLGDNKTYRGLLVHLTIATFISFLLQAGFNFHIPLIHPVFSNSPLKMGLLYSLSYTSGEIINSFLKRQLLIAPGQLTRFKYWQIQYFFDLSDGIILTAIALVAFTDVTITQTSLATIIGIGAHLGIDQWMIRLKVKPPQARRLGASFFKDTPSA